MKSLPKNVVLDHGYLQVRIMYRGRIHCKNFGPDSVDMRLVASKYAADTKLAMRMGTFGVHKDLPSIKFKEAAAIYVKHWSAEKNSEGRVKHTKGSIYTVNMILKNSFISTFGNFFIEDIKPKDVLAWYEARCRKRTPQTASREKGVLSSLFSHLSDWIKQEKISAFKLPIENPCATIESAPINKRERLVTVDELRKIKQSCLDLKDESAWEIITLAIRSLLRKKDLMRLEKGQTIDIKQAKTGVRIEIPVQTMYENIRWENWRKRWEAIRKKAGLEFPLSDPRNLQFKDLRRTGATLLSGQGFSTKLVSQMLGHKSQQTTEIYLQRNLEHLKPLAEALDKIVESI